MRNPILITGCARSGTSLVAGIVHLCGAWKGETSATRYNPHGQFEINEIREGIVKPYLRLIGADPMGQHPLPDIHVIKAEANEMAPTWQKKILDVIKRQGYQGGPWMVKSAKACLIWPLWHKAFPMATWIIVRRKALGPNGIVSSCLRTPFMRAYSDAHGWLGWVIDHEMRFDEMYHDGLDIRSVWPQRIIDGDFTEMQRAIKEIGLKWNQKKVEAFVDRSIWGKRK